MTAHIWYMSPLWQKRGWPQPSATSTVCPNRKPAFYGVLRILLDCEADYSEFSWTNPQMSYPAVNKKDGSQRPFGRHRTIRADHEIASSAICTFENRGWSSFDTGGGWRVREGSHDLAA
jgi:hypothetical protein